MRVLIWLFLACVSLMVAWLLPPETEDLKEIAEHCENRLGDRIGLASLEAGEVIKAIEAQTDWPETKTAFYLVDSSGLLRWNSYWITPASPYPSNEKFTLTTSRRGDFLVVRHPLENRSLDAVIPLKFVGADTEQDWLVRSGVSIHPVAMPGSVPVRIGGREFFWLVQTASASHYPSPWSWLFLVVSIVASAKCCTLWLSFRTNPWIAIPPVVSIILVYRWFMIGPGRLPGTQPGDPLFDPASFASSPFQDSAGNFLINLICLLVIVLLVLPYLKGSLFRFRVGYASMTLFGHIGIFLVLSLLMLLSQLPQFLIAAVYQNSLVSLDITDNLQLDRLRASLMLAVLFGAVAVYLMIKAVWRWVAVRKSTAGTLFWLELLLASMLVLGLLIFYGSGSSVSWYLAIVSICCLAAGTDLRRRFQMTGRAVAASYFLLVMLSVITALNVKHFEQNRSYHQLSQVQENLESPGDEFGTYLLRTAADSLHHDPLIRFAVDNPAGDKRLVINRLELYFAEGYFSDYNFSAGFLSADGGVYAGWLPASLPSLMKSFGLNSLPDSTAQTGFIPALKDDLFRKRFLSVVPVGNRIRGHLVILLEKSVLPASGIRNDLPGIRTSDSKSVGASLWKNGKLIRAAGSFSNDNFMFSDSARLLATDRLPLTQEEGMHLISNPSSSSEHLVVSGERYSFSRLTTNFSLFMVIGFLLLMIPVFINRIRLFADRTSFSYASRIRWYLFTAFVLPLAALAATAVFSVDRSTRERSQAARREMSSRLTVEIERLWSEGGDPADVRRAIIREAGIAGTEVALYSSDGSILFTSRPRLLADGWLAPRVGYAVLDKLRNGASYIEHRETAGSADYLSAYVLTRRSGLIIGFPDFSYSRQLEQDTISGLMVVVPVAAVIFLFFLIFSEAMIHRLTLPIRDVSAALRRTSLAGGNLPLTSSGPERDEMGQMIRSYNDMLGKLEVSRRELAERERESVWREMARRVAHEIRNPLTPIRLAIQRMQMQLSAGTFKAEPAKEALEGILHQTHILNDIATSFSTLAHQPPMVTGRVQLAEVVREAVAVFRSSDEGEVLITDFSENLEVVTDRTFLSRAVSNLVLNAFQSADDFVTIRISAVAADGFAVMRVSDNGPGIDPEIRNRIFDPYFTTRKTGTGLGLTLVQQGLQETGGNIAVETVPGEGACFVVRLPLA